MMDRWFRLVHPYGLIHVAAPRTCRPDREESTLSAHRHGS